MTKTLLLILTTMISIGCINANAIDRKFYTNCKEYYDFQGFYHNECEENKANNYYNNIKANSDFIYKTIEKVLVEESKELEELKRLEEKMKIEEEELKKLEEAIKLEEAKKLKEEAELDEVAKAEEEVAKAEEEAAKAEEAKELEEAKKFEVKIQL